MAWRFELDTPVISYVPKPKKAPNVTLEQIMKQKKDKKVESIRGYYDPMIYEIEEEIAKLREKKEQIERDRDEELKAAEEQFKIEEIENACLICYAEKATETLRCGHVVCGGCLKKIDVCPFDRSNLV
ncbi:unnamed protein product [Blepharisma stoltei]|uniref:RING-type domain-containing protein n=1 Tax=Blepharisma stoltei TaxID=1481888 RepID=A0AAU9ICK6_9CILI|nr:unnamed protein product [Blepharisma stoltei]